MFDKLFSPIKIRDLELKNRIILPAMGTKFATGTKEVNDQMIDYLVARVSGGCGLVFTEVASVHAPSSSHLYISIAEDHYLPGLKRLTDAIHKAGGKIGVQLWLPGLATASTPNAVIFVPSDTPIAPDVTLPGMTIEQIKEVQDSLAAAAKRAVNAGFDCVEFHAAHNYLPHTFLSGAFNHRNDQYGGNLENRMRFLLECIQRIRSEIPDGMPLFMRIDAQDDYLENGLTIEEVITFCKEAGKEGVDALNVSRGNFSSAGLKYEVPPIDLPRGFNVDNAARIRRETCMPTIAVGRINTPVLAEKILEDEKADMVVMGRAQLADSDFCNKCKEGRLEDIDFCVGCNQGCYDANEQADIPYITCLRNPAVGRERECKIIQTNMPRKVFIAGGGIAGLEAAITLKKIGHIPVIYESTDILGGQFVLAGEAPRKSEMKEAVLSMADKAKRMGVEINLNMPLTDDIVRDSKPYAVFNCIGAEPIIPKIPGVEQPFVFRSHDVLAGKTSLTGNIVVIGGGMVGMEVAEYLTEKGCKVVVLEMLPEYCADMGSCRKICVSEAIATTNIMPVTEVKVTSIEKGKVIGLKNNETVEYPCDYAVIAIGSHSRDGHLLEQVCAEKEIKYFVIGDAVKARRAINATREAFDTSLTFDK